MSVLFGVEDEPDKGDESPKKKRRRRSKEEIEREKQEKERMEALKIRIAEFAHESIGGYPPNHKKTIVAQISPSRFRVNIQAKVSPNYKKAYRFDIATIHSLLVGTTTKDDRCELFLIEPEKVKRVYSNYEVKQCPSC